MTPTIEQMCIDAQKRIAKHVNRSAGQHARAMKKAAEKAHPASIRVTSDTYAAVTSDMTSYFEPKAVAA